MQNGNNGTGGGSFFMGSVEWLANLLALVVSFFATPPLFNFSVVFVAAYARDQYGAEWVSLAVLAWGAVIALTTFFLARASIGTCLVMGGLTIAARLFV